MWNIFARLFYQYSGTAISFGDYRHVAKYYLHQLQIQHGLLDDMDSDEDEWSAAHINIGDEQFGHSTATSNRYYGRHDGELGDTRELMLHNFFLPLKQVASILDRRG